ncbi:hypothetical protein H2199_008810 [Coniosporium tulheliwenetii]|uniref:Uncharacterized protein n=1 Tax=Coniosporium tulheliwenetii TaxID=3383036 RepID=A0ACC2YI25_9PEZI|nr:hypothetical protein H2199_008810 [Cladosporium sp. JES 115]
MGLRPRRPATALSTPPPSINKRKRRTEAGATSSKKKRTKKATNKGTPASSALVGRRRQRAAPTARQQAAKTAPRRSRTTQTRTELSRPPPAEPWRRPRSPQPAAESLRLSPTPTPLPPAASSPPTLELPRSAAPARAEEDWISISDALAEDEEDPVFIFSSVWQVRCGRELLESRTAIYRVNQSLNSLRFHDIESFEQRALEDAVSRLFNRRSIRAALSQEKQLTRDNAAQDIRNQQDTYKMEAFLTNWYKHKPQRSLRAHISITVDETVVDLTGDALPEASQSTQPGRHTTTTSQRAEIYERI